jgi:hypothetical protein
MALAEQFTGNDIEEDVRVQALSTLRMEHDDFHFAQDLAKTSDIPQEWSTRGNKEEKEKERARRNCQVFQ